MSEPTRRGRGPAADTRDRLIAGTLACLRESGIDGTTIAAVARASGLSRPTIYAHFSTLDQLIQDAVEHAALEINDRIARRLSAAMTPADSLVEYIVAAHREFKADPVAALVVESSLLPGILEQGAISRRALALAETRIRALLRDDAAALDRLDDVIETTIRFLLSVLAYRSANTRTDEALRLYLRRTFVPALGLG